MMQVCTNGVIGLDEKMTAAPHDTPDNRYHIPVQGSHSFLAVYYQDIFTDADEGSEIWSRGGMTKQNSNGLLASAEKMGKLTLWTCNMFDLHILVLYIYTCKSNTHPLSWMLVGVAFVLLVSSW